MSKGLHVIVGLGATGLSCARYLLAEGYPVAITDTRQSPPHEEALKTGYPEVPIYLGGLDEDLLAKAETLVISPGVALQQPLLLKHMAAGKPVIGDIELFARAAKAPIIAITGTNAKSTVTTLVGAMASASGIKVAVGGNLGTPALDLLAESPELYVLELSSFQLETTYSLAAEVATVLNITPDHMDRYATLEDYRAAKLRIYRHCGAAVCNRDDSLTDTAALLEQQKWYFTLTEPLTDRTFGLWQRGGETLLARCDDVLLPVKALPILGRHYQANALASLAIGHSYGLPMQPMLDVLLHFRGLPHRCQWVREIDGVSWYNDSKGTNVGATLAAIEGLGAVIAGKLVLIAGGVGKNADFSPLIMPIEKYVRAVVLMGEASQQIAAAIGDRVEVHFAKSMEEAVAMAATAAESGDSVLLSPACASLDMFNNFEHRGDVFTQIVEGLA